SMRNAGSIAFRAQTTRTTRCIAGKPRASGPCGYPMPRSHPRFEGAQLNHREALRTRGPAPLLRLYFPLFTLAQLRVMERCTEGGISAEMYNFSNTSSGG